MGWVIIRWARPDILKVCVDTTDDADFEEERRRETPETKSRCASRSMRHSDFVVDDVRRHRSGPPHSGRRLLRTIGSPFVSDFHLDSQYLNEVFDDGASLLAVSLRPTANEAKRRPSFSDRPHLPQTGTVLQVEALSLTFSASPVIWIAILLTDALPHVLS